MARIPPSRPVLRDLALQRKRKSVESKKRGHWPSGGQTKRQHGRRQKLLQRQREQQQPRKSGMPKSGPRPKKQHEQPRLRKRGRLKTERGRLNTGPKRRLHVP